MKDIEGFEKIAKVYFNKTIKEEDIILESTNTFKLPSNMAYNDEGIILLYNIDEITTHTTDIIEFTIPYEDIGSLLYFNSF